MFELLKRNQNFRIFFEASCISGIGDYVDDIPDVKGKITFRTKGQARYVYYEYSREYDPSKQYTNVKRVTIGKVLEVCIWHSVHEKQRVKNRERKEMKNNEQARK